MTKAFSLASWNVEHLGRKRGLSRAERDRRLDRVIDFLQAGNGGNRPDVFAIYEVEGRDVYSKFVRALPDYNFFISEGIQMQEILVGVRSGLTAFITQRDEFKSQQLTLRPGALLTLHVDGDDYSILFMHAKSMPDPKGFGLRQAMLAEAFNLKNALNRAREARRQDDPTLADHPANFMVIGDLNTMGVNYPTDSRVLVSGETEADELGHSAARREMKKLVKSHDTSWIGVLGGATVKSALDHVIAAEHMTFKAFANNAQVDVRGWVQQPTEAEQLQWSNEFSDHSLLYLEVEKAD
ncbi:endonuclease/exonuclease/phosphatase family protein [Aestuariispira ectoiniformans]|uniref:endonuclease/exonuclease/phosphatase family protein n=1 Tax=Aestuariispira ectoiniformans TaxID=2775080 RepID=UPI00223C485C|nr:endonuclease/exonuclease/phosphatase family protein [Aestuariispira ectoiniformans]